MQCADARTNDTEREREGERGRERESIARVTAAGRCAVPRRRRRNQAVGNLFRVLVKWTC